METRTLEFDPSEPIPFDSWAFDSSKLPNVNWRARASTLKPPIKFGVCLWWPEQSPWIHPQDVEIAERFVPGNRVFQRSECENHSDRQLGYSRFSYGEIVFRLLPSIWMEVSHEGFCLRDFVEIKSQQGKLSPGLAEIKDILWNRHTGAIKYHLTQNGTTIHRPFRACDLQPVKRLGSYFSTRELSGVDRLL